MLLLDYWLHSDVIVRLAVCFIFSIKSQNLEAPGLESHDRDAEAGYSAEAR